MRKIYLILARFFHRLNGSGSWHSDPGGVVWRRYNFETDMWEEKPMTAEEATDSIWLWSIK